ncbi:polysaccharide deacetylase family protein [Paenibacillus paeoniae]|uniref:Polysaccharide deacetylase n=1 Tax=Paenibacillus paeoniae TaxID=2292705 RepID=A0A371PG42_9BACL|nr:polysaccharide deacetylase family protein [Paenibacillus paeoniae]REK74882.1 polysaccharide deacetylase [Paenibacillus paeoniae]
MTMQRVVKASICAAVFWFGVMEFGGSLLYKSEAARNLEHSSYVQTVSHQYDARPLLGEPSSGEVQGNREPIEAKNGKEQLILLSRGKKADIGNIPQKNGHIENDSDDRSVTQDGSVSNKAEGGHSNHGTTGEGDSVNQTSKTANQPSEPESAVNKKVIYLTIDDGPSKHTPEVLDILQREGIKATFFVLGEQVERNPDIAKRIVEEGHAIGNHTYDHHYDKLYGSFSEFAKQVMRTDDAIYAATGVRTTLVRAPGGTYSNFDQGYFDALGAAGYRVHDWNVDSGDSKRRGVPSSEIMANIKKSKLPDTLNVLVHDSAGHEESVKALPAIIHYYKQLGFSFETLDHNVKPIQFQLASKSKWARGKVKEGDKTAIVQFGKALDASGARQQWADKEPSLIVHRGEESLVLRAGQYQLIKGSIHVPLMELVEWMGGAAEQDEQSGVVEASLSGKKLFWMMDSWPPSDHESARPEVPLRSMLGQFGIDIEDYAITKDRREVWIKQ